MCEIASEFRYRNPTMDEVDLVMAISQSGETSDTLAALKLCKEKGIKVLSVVNASHSSMARLSDYILYTVAGIEIGVASTKAFTAQVILLLMLAHFMKGSDDNSMNPQWDHYEKELWDQGNKTLSFMEKTNEIAQQLLHLNNILYVGRGTNYPVALEGALKLKELSYIHAHAYAAGELKHGPTALIDESTYVVAIAPNDEWFSKTLSNLQEIRARGGRLIIISDAPLGCFQSMMHHQNNIHHIPIPQVGPYLYPIICTMVVQLLAYNVAILKGSNVDQPRNLAKSVTVE